MYFILFFYQTKSKSKYMKRAAIKTKYTRKLRFSSIKYRIHDWHVANVDSGHDVRDRCVVCFLASDWLPDLPAAFWLARIIRDAVKPRPGKHRKIQRLRRSNFAEERSMFHCSNLWGFGKNAEKVSRHLINEWTERRILIDLNLSTRNDCKNSCEMVNMDTV